MPEIIIIGRAPGVDPDDPVLRDGEVLCVPMRFRDGSSFGGGDLLMRDGSNLSDRLRFASPEVRQRLGLPALHLEDGKGGLAGFAPGYVLAPQQQDRQARADDPARQAYADYVKQLTTAWRNP